MKERNLVWIGLVLMLLTLISACGQTSTSAPTTEEPVGGLQIGDMAPDFTLPDGEGKMWNLAEQLQNNEMVVLVFYHSHT